MKKITVFILCIVQMIFVFETGCMQGYMENDFKGMRNLSIDEKEVESEHNLPITRICFDSDDRYFMGSGAHDFLEVDNNEDHIAVPRIKLNFFRENEKEPYDNRVAEHVQFETSYKNDVRKLCKKDIEKKVETLLKQHFKIQQKFKIFDIYFTVKSGGIPRIITGDPDFTIVHARNFETSEDIPEIELENEDKSTYQMCYVFMKISIQEEVESDRLRLNRKSFSNVDEEDFERMQKFFMDGTKSFDGNDNLVKSHCLGEIVQRKDLIRIDRVKLNFAQNYTYTDFSFQVVQFYLKTLEDSTRVLCKEDIEAKVKALLSEYFIAKRQQKYNISSISFSTRYHEVEVIIEGDPDFSFVPAINYETKEEIPGIMLLVDKKENFSREIWDVIMKIQIDVEDKE